MQTFKQFYDLHQHLNFGDAQDCYEEYKRVHSPLGLVELIAVRTFAKNYGREWKQYLSAAWLSHSYKGRQMGGQDSGTLRAIRNQRGHAWLAEYKFPAYAQDPQRYEIRPQREERGPGNGWFDCPEGLAKQFVVHDRDGIAVEACPTHALAEAWIRDQFAADAAEA